MNIYRMQAVFKAEHEAHEEDLRRYEMAIENFLDFAISRMIEEKSSIILVSNEDFERTIKSYNSSPFAIDAQKINEYSKLKKAEYEGMFFLISAEGDQVRIQLCRE